MDLDTSSFKLYSQNEILGEDFKEIGTQGLRKRVTQLGTSWKTPFPGDEVEVHYSGCIQGGSSFDSSWDRHTPFRFKIGQCEVIKGWDEGISTMKKGEKAVFMIPPHLGYGEMGSPPTIPPNATLIFDVELLSWTSIRDLTNDGGILKKILKDGEGWATPKVADEVLVKFEARFEDQTLISKSQEGVEFYVCDGYLFPAIAKAVTTMRKGEKAELSVKFTYGIKQVGKDAFGSAFGAQSNQNMIIDLELISWKSVINVAEDKRVIKKILREGEGFDHPNEGSVVKVKYTCECEDGIVIESKGSDYDPYEFICFEDHIPEGLFRAIVTMRKGEKSLITICSEYSSNIVVSRSSAQTNGTLIYDVELLSFTKEKPHWKIETAEKLEACEKKKDEGNRLFRCGKFWCSSMKYEKAVKCVEFDHSFTDEEKTRANALRISCHLNNAACKLKLGDYVEASKCCTKVLELDPSNVKALYRRSQSYLETRDLEKAEIDIKKALSINPNNREVKLEYNKLRNKKKEYAKYEAEIFGTVFSRQGN
ncbi:70 kDa peptidyl-prolyl isomerase-like isoform X2 [Papaver somniferum]|uniref:70 kDa peptidyl-prolyl isomerase-like isoform X2 n=1 Tax=Papaver somniferum TaxID=3469 RepID=UPI000E6F53A6|nr:70 kDa peptidyl-prolyl isomerase-like isoform X2 [Papaver somniferum]